MNPDHNKTETINLVIQSVTELRDKVENADKRLREMEIAHGKTVVYCENIIEKIAEMADKSRDFRHDARTKNIELEYKLDQIKTSLENHNLLRQKEAMELSKEQVRVDTRWSILGKPISLLVIGGIVTTLLKALIDLLKK